MSGGVDSTVVVLMMKLTGEILFNIEFRETMKLENTIKSNSSISRISTLNSQVIQFKECIGIIGMKQTKVDIAIQSKITQKCRTYAKDLI